MDICEIKKYFFILVLGDLGRNLNLPGVPQSMVKKVKMVAIKVWSKFA